jgi:hypothetical protein
MDKNKSKEKQYFDIVLEAQIPCIVKYRVLAESAEEALEEIKRSPPVNVKPILNQKRDIKATVYNSGSSMIQYIKRWF